MRRPAVGLGHQMLQGPKVPFLRIQGQSGLPLAEVLKGR